MDADSEAKSNDECKSKDKETKTVFRNFNEKKLVKHKISIFYLHFY